LTPSHEAKRLIELVSEHVVNLNESTLTTLNECIDNLNQTLANNERRISAVVSNELKFRMHQKCHIAGIRLNRLNTPRARFQTASSLLDTSLHEDLLRKRYVGKILEVDRSDYNVLCPSEVSFRWQAGLQIGRGRFGIVYSAVNLDTGGMMALKIVYLHKILDKKDSEKVGLVADEINNTLKIEHENLVRVYGAELNRVS
jgi:hypothetical protein